MAILSIAGLYASSGGFTTAFGFGIASMLAGGLSETKGPRIKNLDTQTSEPGQAIPWVYGTVRIAGNIIWASKLREKKKSKRGGKGIGPKTTTFTYSEGVLICFARGPIQRFDKIQMDAEKKMFWSYNDGDQKPFNMNANTSTGMWTKSGRPGGIIGKRGATVVGGGEYVFLNGTKTHLPLSGIEAVEGVGFVPAYRNRACIYFDNLKLTRYGNRFPTVTAWIVADKESVADILRDMIKECAKRLGFALDTSADVTADIDVSAVRGDIVDGFVIESIDGAEQRVEELGAIFGFDWVKRGEKLVVVKRGGSVVRNIPQSELRWSRGDSESPERGLSLAAIQSLPQAVEMTFINPLKKNRSDVTRSPVMPQATSRRIDRFQTSMVMKPAVARSVARRLCYETWNRAMQRVEHLDWRHLDLGAADPIALATALGMSDWVIESATGELMGPLEVTINPHDPYLYGFLSVLNLDPLPEPTEAKEWVAPLLFASDAPGISASSSEDGIDSLTEAGIWVAASAKSSSEWEGATMEVQSFNQAQGTWSDFGSLFSAPDQATMGVLKTNYIPQSPESGYDSSQSILTETFIGDLFSAPIADVHKGANLILFENGIFVSFKDALASGISAEGNKIFSLSTLKAGRAGSDDLFSLLPGGVIAAGTRFILVRDEDNEAAEGVIFRKLGNTLSKKVLRVRGSTTPDYSNGGDEEIETRNIGTIDGTGVFKMRNIEPLMPTITVAKREANGELKLKGRPRTRYAVNSSLSDTQLHRLGEPKFADGYKYEVTLKAQGTFRVITLYTKDDEGSFDWVLSGAEIANLFGFIPNAGQMTGTVALFGNNGPGRKRAWSET